MKILSFTIQKGMALRVSSIYIIVSVLYIFCTFKGWGFVLLSGLLIYWLIRQSQLKSIINEERFQLFANLSFEGIVLHKNGIVIDANNAFTNYFGYKLKDVIDKNLEDFFIKEEFKPIFNSYLTSQNTELYNVQAIIKNGDYIWVQIINEPYKHNGEKVSVCAIRDITRQIEAEEKLKNNEAFFIARYNLEHGVPSLGTVFNNMKHISYDEMNKALWIWMTQYVDKSEDLWIAIDGKALGSTSTDVQGSEQNYKSMVSMFVQSKGVVLNAVSIQLKKSNEGDAARDLINALEAKGMTFTMDALHCQKKLLRPSWSQEMTM